MGSCLEHREVEVFEEDLALEGDHVRNQEQGAVVLLFVKLAPDLVPGADSDSGLSGWIGVERVCRPHASHRCSQRRPGGRAGLSGQKVG